jgi:hypothetical protein
MSDNKETKQAPAVEAGAREILTECRDAIARYWEFDVSKAQGLITRIESALARASEAAAGETQQAYDLGYQHGMDCMRYTQAMGVAAEAYFASFKSAHPLPTQFRWSKVYEAMTCAAAPQPASETREAFALKALVAAGHIAQEKVDRALTVAAKFNAHLAAREPVEEGCTPADAKMLREANHGLAAENDRLRRRLRPFAMLATPRLSWAMVEYCIDGDPEKQTLQAPQMQRAFNRAAESLADELPSPAPVDCEALDLPDWVKNAKPPAPDQPASEQQAAPTLNLPPMLTPFGMLVRALRIVAGTTLYDMAKALLTTPAKLSAMEFGRAEVTPEFAFDVAAYFDALGIACTESALRVAAAKGDGHD